MLGLILELLALMIAVVMILEILKAEVPMEKKIPWIAILAILAVVGLLVFYSVYFVVLAFVGILAYYFIGRPKMMR